MLFTSGLPRVANVKLQLCKEIYTTSPCSSLCIAGDTLATSTNFMPQLYEVTYVLKETNFVGDETQADMMYTAQSSMHLDVVHPTQALKFNSLDLDITRFSYLLDDWMDVCLCGYQYQCMSHDCKEMVRPDG